MISLTRLTGARFALNPDLVERVDCTPDTVITLVDGTKYLVSESLQDVVDLVLEYRAQVVAGAGAIEQRDTSLPRRTRLSAVPAPGRDDATGPDAAGHHPDSTDDSVVSLEPRTI